MAGGIQPIRCQFDALRKNLLGLAIRVGGAGLVPQMGKRGGIPCSTLVCVSQLFKPDALVEIEAIDVIGAGYD